MSLYVCQQCQNIENTALSSYWWNPKHLCSKCEPTIGKWHGRFAETKFNPETDKLVEGFVERK